MIIYATRIDQDISKTEYNKFVCLISSYKREQIQQYKFDSDKRRTLFGELLLRYGIYKNSHKLNEPIKIEIGENGKPYCYSPPNIHFNISHSGIWVVCALSDAPIGIDIEKIQEAQIEIAKRFFTPYESKQITSAKGDQDQLFYKYWTLKESFIKYKGKGFGIPLDSFEFIIHDNQVTLKTSYEDNPNFSFQKIGSDYYFSVCTSKPIISTNIEFITLKDLSILL